MCKKDNIIQCKTGVEKINYAVTHGGKIARTTGDHVIIEGPTGGICPVPYDRNDTPKGTHCSILKRFKAIGILMGLGFLVFAYGPALLGMM
jgi:hypothetical protein